MGPPGSSIQPTVLVDADCMRVHWDLKQLKGTPSVVYHQDDSASHTLSHMMRLCDACWVAKSHRTSVPTSP